MEKTNEKKVLVLSFLGVITLIAVVVGATFAYFAAQSGGTGNININANTATTDNLSFQVGSAISLTANQEDFGSGMGNKSGNTFARATLTANNATNNATRNYYVYLDITSNDFEYTTEDSQAEILLKVTDPDGTEVTTLGSLERKTSGGETGFDITTSTGLITIADNYEITSTGTVTQDWTVEVIFANLDSDQNANTGKTFTANLIIQEEEILNFANYIVENIYTGTDGENDLYYHDGTGTYGTQEAGDNSYRYTGANPNNYVCFGSDEELCPNDNLYRIIGVFDNQIKLIKYDYAGETILGTAPASSGSPNAGYYKGSLSLLSYYYWSGLSSNQSNDWSASELNINVLNGTYLTNLGSKWSDLISTTSWQVGGNTDSNIRFTNAKSAYDYEIVNPVEVTTYLAKIGLMYMSDYYYGATPIYWSYPGYNSSNTNDYRSAINDNWMFMGGSDWTITHNSDTTDIAFGIDSTGAPYFYTVNVSGRGIRPVFYLNANVILTGGNGTSADPYRIQTGA